MNSPRDLSRRLLRLYPVKLVKDYFNPDSVVQNDIIDEVVGNSTERIIKDFACANHNHTKQHVYLFRLNNNFNINNFNKNSFPFVIENEAVVDGGYRFRCLPRVDFQVVIKEVNYLEVVIQFLQPIAIHLRGRDLIIQTTILEKNINSYFPANQQVIDVKKENSEDIIINELLRFFNGTQIVNVHDVNRGIKHLWENNLIDSKFAKWKKDRSTTTEAMDEEYTLKEQYPDVYANLIQSPINKTVFKYKGDNDDFPKHFTADPTAGTLSFATYPETTNQIENVIREILSNN